MSKITNKFNIGDYVEVNIEDGRKKFNGEIIAIYSYNTVNISYKIKTRFNIEIVGEAWILKKIASSIPKISTFKIGNTENYLKINDKKIIIKDDNDHKIVLFRNNIKIGSILISKAVPYDYEKGLKYNIEIKFKKHNPIFFKFRKKEIADEIYNVLSNLD